LTIGNLTRVVNVCMNICR